MLFTEDEVLTCPTEYLIDCNRLLFIRMLFSMGISELLAVLAHCNYLDDELP